MAFICVHSRFGRFSARISAEQQRRDSQTDPSPFPSSVPGPGYSQFFNIEEELGALG